MGGIFSNVLITSFGKTINLVISLCTTLIVARVLSPSDFGILAMCSVFLGISTVFVEAGLGSSLIFHKDTKDIDNHTIFWFNFLMSVIVYLFIFILAKPIASFYNSPVLASILKVIGLSIIFHSFCIVQTALMTKELRFAEQAKIAIYSSLISSVCVIVFAYLRGGVWTLVLQTILNNVFTVTFFFYFCRYKPKFKFSIRILKRHWNFGIELLGSSILKLVYDNMYVQTIGKIATLNDAGYYNQAKKFNDVPFNMLQDPINRVVFPSLVNDNSMIEHTKRITSLLSFTIIPLLVMGAILSPDLLIVLIGIKWETSGWMLSIMLIGTIGAIFENLNRNYIKALGRTDIILKTDFVKRIVCLTILMLSLYWGIKGVLFAFVINGFLGWIMNCFAYKEIGQASIFSQTSHVFQGFAVSCFIGILTFTCRLVVESHIVRVLLIAFVYIILYSFVIRFWKKDVYKFFVSINYKSIRKHE